jgi:hypothetical protein
MTANLNTTDTQVTTSRRKLLQAGAATAALGVFGAPAIVRAQSAPKIRIGYWPIAAGATMSLAGSEGASDLVFLMATDLGLSLSSGAVFVASDFTPSGFGKSS